MIEEGGVHGLADGVVAAEGEGNIADAAADLGAGEILLDPMRGGDEVHRVIVVLLHAGGNGEHVWVKYNVVRRKSGHAGEEVVGAGADFDAARQIVGLAALVEGHDHDGGAVTADEFGLVQEFFLAFLEADGIDHGLALEAFQTGFDHGPLGAVHHHRHARDFRFGGDEIEEMGHGLDAVEHSFVEIDVNDLRAVVHLLTGHGQRLLILRRARDHLEKRGEPVTLVRSPMLTKLVSGRMVRASIPLRRK